MSSLAALLLEGALGEGDAGPAVGWTPPVVSRSPSPSAPVPVASHVSVFEGPVVNAPSAFKPDPK